MPALHYTSSTSSQPRINRPRHPPPRSSLPQKRIELVDSYARVIAMIEIEVEMDSDLPAAEVLGGCRAVQRREMQGMGVEGGVPPPASLLPAVGSVGASGLPRLLGLRCSTCTVGPVAWPPTAAACPPAACPPRAGAGIEEQIARLSEIESLQEEWQIQVCVGGVCLCVGGGSG